MIKYNKLIAYHVCYSKYDLKKLYFSLLNNMKFLRSTAQ